MVRLPTSCEGSEIERRAIESRPRVGRIVAFGQSFQVSAVGLAINLTRVYPQEFRLGNASILRRGSDSNGQTASGSVELRMRPE